MKRLVFAVLGCLSIGLVSACGGGGGGGTTTSGSSASTQQTKAVLQLSSVGSAGVKLSGVGITIHLPVGVTPKTDSNGVVLSSVVTPSGVAVGSSMTPPQYTPAQSGTPGTLSFVLASNSTGGFGPGEFVTVNLDIAPGSSVKASDFTLSDFKPIDLNYANISDMSASLTADIL
jgi:hypothetical protein